MKLKFLDTQTGNTAWSDYPFSVWWWSEGNGACDCNRASCFGIDDHDCTTDKYRFLAVDVVDHEDKSVQEQLDELNQYLAENYLQTKEDILAAVNEGLY